MPGSLSSLEFLFFLEKEFEHLKKGVKGKEYFIQFKFCKTAKINGRHVGKMCMDFRIKH